MLESYEIKLQKKSHRENLIMLKFLSLCRAISIATLGYIQPTVCRLDVLEGIRVFAS